LLVTGVVGPVLPAEVEGPAELTPYQLFPDGADPRAPAIGESDPSHDACGVNGVDHGADVGRAGGQRLLAEDVLARGGELNDHLPVQVVRHDHTDDVDVLRVDDGLLARVVALEAITPRRVARQVFIDVRHRHEGDGWQGG
jgi:hypothetical protein